jgi:hypothetical protein
VYHPAGLGRELGVLNFEEYDIFYALTKMRSYTLI